MKNSDDAWVIEYKFHESLAQSDKKVRWVGSNINFHESNMPTHSFTWCLEKLEHFHDKLGLESDLYRIKNIKTKAIVPWGAL